MSFCVIIKSMKTLKYDAVIFGTGGAGLRAALEIVRRGGTVAIISKTYATRSHTCAAQGGIACSLGNEEDDSWLWHMFDTIKGGDFLTDQDAAEVLAKEAPTCVIELENMGLPFSRNENGKMSQRRFGGHTKNFGKEAVKRLAFSADRTGHMIVHILYEQLQKYENAVFFPEHMILDLIIDNGRCVGSVVMDISNSEIKVFHSKATLLATGGHGKLYRVTSNAYSNTGDGFAVAAKAGLILQDIEFVQFHPTGLHPLGILITEGARGEGGILLNKKGERFMERYAPTLKDLAPRDIVSRSIYTEIKEGRGVDDKYVWLDIRHIGSKRIKEALAEINDFCLTYLKIDPSKELIPVHPTCHYIMGGIPTDTHGRVIKNDSGDKVKGLWSAGEAACVSVHGANRLGGNSLADLIVFGKRAGLDMAGFIAEESFAEIPEKCSENAEKLINELLREKKEKDISHNVVRKKLQDIMWDNASVFRDETSLKNVRNEIEKLEDEARFITVKTKSKTFNMELVESIETINLIILGKITVESALERRESRGSHSRLDYQERNDRDFLYHTTANLENGKIKLGKRPIVITRFKPTERKY